MKHRPVPTTGAEERNKVTGPERCEALIGLITTPDATQGSRPTADLFDPVVASADELTVRAVIRRADSSRWRPRGLLRT